MKKKTIVIKQIIHHITPKDKENVENKLEMTDGNA